MILAIILDNSCGQQVNQEIPQRMNGLKCVNNQAKFKGNLRKGYTVIDIKGDTASMQAPLENTLTLRPELGLIISLKTNEIWSGFHSIQTSNNWSCHAMDG